MPALVHQDAVGELVDGALTGNWQLETVRNWQQRATPPTLRPSRAFEKT
jgi:hypothetical protein